MATSGSINSGGYQGRTLQFSWSTQSTSGNTRTIAYEVKAVGGSSSTYYHHNETVDLNGTRIYTGSSSHAVTTNDTLASGTMSINQSSTTTLTVSMHGGIYVNSDNINTTQSWTLDTLIQAPVINSLTVANRTENSIICNFNVNKADTYYYKLSTASTWTRGSNNVTSGSFTVTGLNPNTSYEINFIARNWINESTDTYMDANKSIISTTLQSPTQSLNTKTETTIKMNWSADTTVDYVWYSKDNGSNWTAVGSVNATSGNYTISNLTANTTYNIKTRIRRKATQTTYDTTALSVATYNYPNITVVGTIDLKIGSSQTLTLYNPLSRSVTVKMNKDSASGTQLYSGTTSGTTLTFTPTESTLYASIPSATSGKCVYSAIYSGTTKSTTGNYTYKIKGTELPTFSNWTYVDTNSTTTALTGNNQILVKGYSNVKATVSTANKATANNSATMSSYKLVIGSGSASANYSSSANVDITLNAVSTNTMTLSATDSRGLSKSISKTATFKEYSALVIKEVTATRSNNGVGKAVTLKFNGTFWNSSFGNTTNTIKSVTYKFKESSASSWNTGGTTLSATTSGNNYSGEFSIRGDLGADGFSVEKSFNIRLTVTDELSTKEYDVTIGSGTPALAIYKDNIAIGQKYDEEEGSKLQVNGSANLAEGESIKFGGVKTLRKNTNNQVILSSTGGTVYIRPNGDTNSTGEATLGADGNLTATKFTGSFLGNASSSSKTKGTLTNPTSGTTYFIPFYSTETTGNKDLRQNNGMRHITQEGTTTTDGQSILLLGNGTASGTAGNKYGVVRLQSNSTGRVDLKHALGSTSNTTLYFPDGANGYTLQTKPKLLYSNSTGVTGTVTLSESANNFNYLEIFFVKETLNNSVRVASPNGKYATLTWNQYTGGVLQAISKKIYINGTSITVDTNNSGYGNVTASGNNVAKENAIYITKVIGYK